VDPGTPEELVEQAARDTVEVVRLAVAVELVAPEARAATLGVPVVLAREAEAGAALAVPLREVQVQADTVGPLVLQGRGVLAARIPAATAA
jgi:hypothetical protein